MQGLVTMDELRELSRRSRRASTWGIMALLGTLLMFPALAIVLDWAPAWHRAATYTALVAGGALMLRYAYVAGEERGAYRRVFRRVQKESRAAARRVPVEEPAAMAVTVEEGDPNGSATGVSR